MSGVKTVTVDSQEYRRLRDQASRASTLQAANRALSQMNDSLTSAVTSANRQISSLQTNINSLNSRITATAAAASKQAQALRQQLEAEVRQRNAMLAQQALAHQQQLEDVRQECNSSITAMRQEVSTVISRNNTRIQNQLDGIRDTVQDLNEHVQAIDATLAAARADTDALREHAQEFIRVARELNEDSGTYRCEVLLPGEFARVRGLLTQAEADLQIPGNESVARNNARMAYEQALWFHDRIIQAEQEWIIHQQAARQALASAQARIDSSREVTVGPRNTVIDGDYWSGGDLSQLAGEVRALEQRLQSRDISLADLDRIRSAGDTIDAEALDAAAFAMAASINSQSRIAMNANLGRQLRERAGLSLVSQSYQGGDQRAAHRMHLRNNVTGFEMIITQTPIVAADGTMAIDVDSHITNFGTNNAQIADEIARTALQLVVGDRCDGPIATAPGYETRPSDQVSAADMPTWQTETAPAIPRPVRNDSNGPQSATT